MITDCVCDFCFCKKTVSKLHKIKWPLCVSRDDSQASTSRQNIYFNFEGASTELLSLKVQP